MKIPSMPKGLIGMPAIIVLGGIGIWYFFIRDKNGKNKKG